MESLSRAKKISLSSLIVLSGFIFAAVYYYYTNVYRGLGYPLNTFLFNPNDRWMDFINLVLISHDPYATVRGWPNFPFLYRVAWLFSYGPINVLTLVYLLIFLIFFISIVWMNIKTENRIETITNVVILGFLSYPFLFSIDRANFEMVVFACLYGFFTYYRKNSFIASTFLAIAVALKFFPAILAILFLADKKYKELFLAAGLSLVLTLVSYAILPGGLIVNLLSSLENIKVYNDVYIIQNASLAFGNNLFGAIKYVAFLINPALYDDPSFYDRLSNAIPGYYALVISLILGFGFYLTFVEKKFWKKAAIVVCALNLLPTVSADYKLLHIFLIFFLFINESSTDPVDILYLVILDLLLIPKNYLHFRYSPEITSSVLTNPLLMAALITLIIWSGIRDYRKSRITDRQESISATSM